MTCKRCSHCDRPMDDEGDFIDCLCSDCVWADEVEYEDDTEDDWWL